ncbi:MAG: hypothetical protein ABMA64_33500, partial [Myxococcota bacterium]
MQEQIVPIREQLSERFPVASFSVRVPNERYFEVVCATDPRLFHLDARPSRSPTNFYTTRPVGMLRAPGGETTFILPSDQLKRFAGSRRIYYALATYGDPTGRDPRFTIGPDALDRAPSIALAADFTGNALDRRRLGGAPPPDDRYGSPGPALAWGGDDVLEAEQRAAEPMGYQDGFDPALWTEEDRYGDPDPAAMDDSFGEELDSFGEAYAEPDPAAMDDSFGEAYAEPDPAAMDDSFGADDEDPPEAFAQGDVDYALVDDETREPPATDHPLEPRGLGYDEAELDQAHAAPEDEELPRFGAVYGSPDAVAAARHPEYAPEFGEEPLDGAPAAAAVLTVADKVQLLRVIARGESGARGYAAVDADVEYADPQHPAYQRTHFGLSFGLLLFPQRSGLLGAVLAAARERSRRLAGRLPPDTTFEAVFGPASDELVANLTSPDEARRMAPVGGAPLWSDGWRRRFERAGNLEYVQAAQNEVAVVRIVDPVLPIARALDLVTLRSLALLLDRCVHMGVGGGARWVLQRVSPL